MVGMVLTLSAPRAFHCGQLLSPHRPHLFVQEVVSSINTLVQQGYDFQLDASSRLECWVAKQRGLLSSNVNFSRRVAI